MEQIKEIIKMASLQKEIANRVIEAFPLLNMGEYQVFIDSLLNKDTAQKAREELSKRLEPDPDNIKILTIMLYTLRFTYQRYKEMGIPQQIFIDTIGCYQRFINEHYIGYKKWSFDREWWAYKQLALIVFRIGILEFEMKDLINDKYISVHIPSDSILSPYNIKESLIASKNFFKKFFPEYQNLEVRCRSWMLSPTLEELLAKTSNILYFKNLFRIVKEDYEIGGLITWVYKRHYDDYKILPEETTLQRNLKRYLLSEQKFRIGTGILKEEAYLK